MRRKIQVYTKQCADGTACAGWFGSAAFIPEEDLICDACLLHRFGVTRETYDGCGDPLSMSPLYRQEDVVEALRRASGL